MSTWADEYITLIEDCEERSDRLSDWEAGFIDSLRRQMEEGRSPTPKQVDCLDSIWEKATKKG